MADTAVTLLVGVAGLGAAYLGYQALKSQPAAPPPGANPPAPGAAPNPLIASIPADLLHPMQAAFWLSGSNKNNFGAWVNAMQTVVPASGQAWQYVYNQWNDVYTLTNGWPSNAQLITWLTAGINTYG